MSIIESIKLTNIQLTIGESLVPRDELKNEILSRLRQKINRTVYNGEYIIEIKGIGNPSQDGVYPFHRINNGSILPLIFTVSFLAKTILYTKENLLHNVEVVGILNENYAACKSEYCSITLDISNHKKIKIGDNITCIVIRALYKYGDKLIKIGAVPFGLYDYTSNGIIHKIKLSDIKYDKKLIENYEEKSESLLKSISSKDSKIVKHFAKILSFIDSKKEALIKEFSNPITMKELKELKSEYIFVGKHTYYNNLKENIIALYPDKLPDNMAIIENSNIYEIITNTYLQYLTDLDMMTTQYDSDEKIKKYDYLWS
jgi:hypothetical protein